MGKLRLANALAGFLALAFACSCSSSAPPTPPISVQVSVSATQTDQGKSVTITATVTNDSSERGVSWSLNGPGSLTNPTTSSVTYTATSGGSSVQSATITATSIADNTKTASVGITINLLPSITTTSLPGGSAGAAYSQTLTESGGTPPFTWSTLSWSAGYGALPNGLSLGASTGTISGTLAEGGTWYFWVQLADSVGATAMQPSLSIEVLPNTPAGNPVPYLNQSVVPDAVAPGGPQFTLTVNGIGFLPTSTVDFNGTALATTFMSKEQLTAVVPAADIATAATASITVVNPSPGGGSSNAVYFPVSTPEANVTFSNAPGSPISMEVPDYVVAGDFRGQGKPDLAIGQNGPQVYIYLANGDGTFTQAADSPVIVPRMPWNNVVNPLMVFLATGDFNNSGKLGLAVANLYGSVPILLGNGDGTFTLPTSFVNSEGMYANSVAIGDFLGNGDLDLVVANSPEGPADILLGCGDGGFIQGPFPPAGNLTGAYMPAVGDFNGDGKLDIALTGGGYGMNTVNEVMILLGNGDGTFSLAPNSTFATGNDPWAIVAADFNGDGKLDLAIANQGGSTLTILLGNGDGTFTPSSGSPVAVGRNPYALAAADLNSDGKLDLVVGNSTDSTLSILLGNGDGTFTPAASSPVALPSPPTSIAVGDFNGSGRLGLAVTMDVNVAILVQQP
jgi:hypothetical protein